MGCRCHWHQGADLTAAVWPSITHGKSGRGSILGGAEVSVSQHCLWSFERFDMGAPAFHVEHAVCCCAQDPPCEFLAMLPIQAAGWRSPRSPRSPRSCRCRGSCRMLGSWRDSSGSYRILGYLGVLEVEILQIIALRCEIWFIKFYTMIALNSRQIRIECKLVEMYSDVNIDLVEIFGHFFATVPWPVSESHNAMPLTSLDFQFEIITWRWWHDRADRTWKQWKPRNLTETSSVFGGVR